MESYFWAMVLSFTAIAILAITVACALEADSPLLVEFFGGPPPLPPIDALSDWPTREDVRALGVRPVEYAAVGA